MSPPLRPTHGFSLAIALCFMAPAALVAAQVAGVAPSATPSNGYRIAGVVVNKADGHPLANARIDLREVKARQKAQSVVTSENGKFEFTKLPAEKYSLIGNKRGYISAAYDQHDQFDSAIVTGAGLDTENLVLKLSPNAVITGRVLDETGEPLRQARVTLYYDNHQSGVDEIHSFRSTQTDDLGTYEITPLMPGTYFLSVTATPWYAIHSHAGAPDPQGNSPPAVAVDRSLDVAYPTTYYADVAEVDEAMPMPVRGGDHLQVDIHLTPVPALRMLLHVPHDEKTGAFSFPHLEQPAFDGSAFVPADGARVISPGLVEISGIPAGRYNIRLQGSGPGAQMDGVDLVKDETEVDTSAAPPLSTVKLSARLAAQGSLPPQLSVALRSKALTFTGSQKLDSKGEAEIHDIPAGRYEIMVLGSTRRYLVTQISAEGAEVIGHTVIVAAGTSPSLSLTVVEAGAELRGIATRAGKGAPGAMVVLVPKTLEGNRELFRRDQSDLDGTFTLRDVVPGSYTLLAIDNGWDLDWSRAEVISAYLKRGRPIEVENRSGANLPEEIEIQSK